jgi:hypothetical protein
MGIRTFSPVAIFAVMLLTAGLLSGCGGNEGTRPAASRGSASPSASGRSAGASVTQSASPSGGSRGETSGRREDPGSPGSASPAELVLSGTVEAGVEPGCVVLRASGQTYLLLGGDRARLSQGGAITVRGRTDPGLMTTCQQGTPLRVLELRTP